MAAIIMAAMVDTMVDTDTSKNSQETKDPLVVITLLRPSADIEHAMTQHSDSVWRVSFVMLSGNEHDAQDVYQDVFLRYALEERTFNDDEHVKAWLITTTKNRCLDILKAASRKVGFFDEDVSQIASTKHPDEQPDNFRSEVIDALFDIDDPPRTPLYLALVEEYPATEIAEMLDVSVNTVYSWISRGKEKLKEALR